MRCVCLCLGAGGYLDGDVARITGATRSLCKRGNQFPSASHSPAQGCAKKIAQLNSWAELNCSWQVEMERRRRRRWWWWWWGCNRFQTTELEPTYATWNPSLLARPPSHSSPGTIDVGLMACSHVTVFNFTIPTLTHRSANTRGDTATQHFIAVWRTSRSEMTRHALIKSPGGLHQCCDLDSVSLWSHQIFE